MNIPPLASPVSFSSLTAPKLDVGPPVKDVVIETPQIAVPRSVQVLPEDQRPTAQQSADSILGFIERGLAAKQASGASDEEIQALYNEAVKGFEQGLAEAVDIIQSYGLLDERLQEGIAKTESLVLAGLEAIAKDLGIGESPLPVISPPVAPERSDVITTVVGSQSESVRESFSYAQSNSNTDSSVSSKFGLFAESFNSSRAIDLQVLTNDGDLVTFSFDSSFSSLEGGAYAFFDNEKASFAGASAFLSESSATSVSFTVQGDLDDGELASLNALFTEIDQLAKEFFEGDFDKAFEMALDLRIDVSELAALSLDINQQVSQSSIAAYNEVSQIDPEQVALNSAEQGFNQLREIGEYINKLLDTLDKVAKDIAEPIDLFADLLVKDIAEKDQSDDERPSERTQRSLALADQLLGFLRG